MDESATVALVAVAAVALVFIVMRRQEANAQMAIAQIRAQQQRSQSGQDSGALSLGDVIAVGGTAVATYLGGPSAGAKAAAALAPQ